MSHKYGSFKLGRPWLALASALLIINPILGLIGFGLLFWRTPDVREYRLWLALWLGVLVLLLPSLIIHRDVLFAGQLLLGLGASLTLVAKPRDVNLGLSAVLLIALPFALSQRYRSADLWLDSDLSPILNEWLTGQSLLNKDTVFESGRPWTAVKSWRVSDANESKTRSVTLSFDVRRVSGQAKEGWYAYNPLFSFERKGDFLRVQPPPPSQEQRYITKELNAGVALAGRTFRASVQLRSPQSFVGRGCQGLRLQAIAGQRAGTCTDVTLTKDWQRYELVWTAPSDVDTPVIRMSLYTIDVDSYDVRGASLEELREGVWREVEPLEPEGLLIKALAPGVHRSLTPRLNLIPGDTWERVTFVVDTPWLENTQDLTFVAQVAQGAQIAVKDVKLSSDTSPQPTPRLRPRQNLWFSHANIAGHTLATTSLVLATLSQMGWGLLGVVAGLLSVMLTGSRAAWLAFILGAVLLLPYSAVRKRGWLLGVSLALGGVLGTAALWGRGAAFTEATNTVSRFNIWRVTGQVFLEHPWFGIGAGPASFSDVWRTLHPGSGFEPIGHAHNVWLQFAVSYGVPGVAASLWLTIGFIYLAWRWGRWRALVPTLAVLTMNTVDYTFFSSGVLFTLILSLNTFRLSSYQSRSLASVSSILSAGSDESGG